MAMISALGVHNRLAVQEVSVVQGTILCKAGEKLRVVHFSHLVRTLLDVRFEEWYGCGDGGGRPRE
jgi:hypothetical protein